MIFVGGSNISFGLDSQMIKDSLNVNPINTGISASLGLKYMLDNTIQYVKEGDILIAPLEYDHYVRDYNYCIEPLLRLVLDVDNKYFRLLNFQQAFNLLSDLPMYIISKFKPTSYFGFEINPPYERNSFNIYGDECAHWDMENCEFVKTHINDCKTYNTVVVYLTTPLLCTSQHRCCVSHNTVVVYLTTPLLRTSQHRCCEVRNKKVQERKSFAPALIFI
jgi:hypothetical protein